MIKSEASEKMLEEDRIYNVENMSGKLPALSSQHQGGENVPPTTQRLRDYVLQNPRHFSFFGFGQKWYNYN